MSPCASILGRHEICFRSIYERNYAKTHKDLAVGVYLEAGSLEATTPEVEVLGEVVNGMSRLGGFLPADITRD